MYEAWPLNRGGGQSADYAVKTLRAEWSDNRQAIACLRREAEVSAHVAHPRLVAVLSAQLDQPPYYLVTPRLRGKPLDRRLHAKQRLSLTMSLCVARQVAEALAALAEHGWTHGDVKPANIFLSPEGRATLLDLGFARRADEPRRLRQDTILGALAYLAPEAITSTLAPDIRSDIYSLGVTLYEMLAGRPPFVCDEAGELVRLHREGAPPPLRRRLPETPREVAALVHEMLAKEPLRRPQTPTELVRRLVALEILTFEELRRLDGLSGKPANPGLSTRWGCGGFGFAQVFFRILVGRLGSNAGRRGNGRRVTGVPWNTSCPATQDG